MNPNFKNITMDKHIIKTMMMYSCMPLHTKPRG